MRDFEDEMVVERMMRMFEAFELPTEIDRSLYWQIWLTGPEWYTYNKNQTSGPSGRALTLFRRLIHLHQRAS